MNNMEYKITACALCASIDSTKSIPRPLLCSKDALRSTEHQESQGQLAIQGPLGNHRLWLCQ